MFDTNQNNSVLTVSPPDSGFSPRREFVRDNHVPSAFALLSIAGTSLVRLSAFPKSLKVELKRALEVRASIRAVREDPSLNLLEFNVDGKPWASSKSIHSEILFLDILSLILFYGFRYVSTIDYGREHDDKLCIAFSRRIPVRTSIARNSPSYLPFLFPPQQYYASSMPLSTPHLLSFKVSGPLGQEELFLRRQYPTDVTSSS